MSNKADMKWVSQKIEEWAPLSFAEEYDNVGLLIGSKFDQVSKVLVALDATMPVIDEAIDGSYDCIVTHHPIIREPMRRIIETEPVGDKVIKLIKNGIGLYTAHTNLDKAIGGVSDCLAQKLKIDCATIMQKEPSNGAIGFGRVGELTNEVIFSDFADYVKQALELKDIRCVGLRDTKIKKVAVCGGSGMNFWRAAKDLDCQVYITGDVKYSDAFVAKESGLCVIDITHYSSENFIVEAIVEYLRKKAKQEEYNIQIEQSGYDGQTFYTV